MMPPELADDSIADWASESQLLEVLDAMLVPHVAPGARAAADAEERSQDERIEGGPRPAFFACARD